MQVVGCGAQWQKWEAIVVLGVWVHWHWPQEIHRLMEGPLQSCAPTYHQELHVSAMQRGCSLAQPWCPSQGLEARKSSGGQRERTSEDCWPWIREVIYSPSQELHPWDSHIMLPGAWSAAGIHPLCNTCWHLVAAIHPWLDKSIFPYFLISFLVVSINSWVSLQSTPFSWRLRTPAASSYFQTVRNSKWRDLARSSKPAWLAWLPPMETPKHWQGCTQPRGQRHWPPSENVAVQPCKSHISQGSSAPSVFRWPRQIPVLKLACSFMYIL